jgi:glutathione synthase/RimK-type ligase-like ATP-grasp enzyme
LLDWRLDTGDGLLEIGGRQCRLSEVGLLIYRRPIPAHQLRTDIEPWIRRLLDSEWSAIEFALSRAVDCRVMNGLAGSALAQNKIVQLRAAREAGLNVPETLISTDADSLRAFAREHRCITKGIVNAFHLDGKHLRSAFTSFVDATTLDTFDPSGSPTLLQRTIEAAAIWRIVMVGGKAMGFRFHGEELAQVADSRPIERRLNGAYESVPVAVAASLAALCGALSIEFASSDFVEDTDGQLWFLDLNPEGQWAYLEDQLGVRISDEIVALADR